jgi:hypothetical protein
MLYSDQKRLLHLAQGIGKFNQRYNWPAQRIVYIHLVDQLAQCRTD